MITEGNSEHKGYKVGMSLVSWRELRRYVAEGMWQEGIWQDKMC